MKHHGEQIQSGLATGPTCVGAFAVGA
jgi:hypothetical protein